MKRKTSMDIAEFIEKYLSGRHVRPFQKQIIEKMAKGEKLTIMRPQKSVTAQFVDERVVVKPYQQKKQKLFVVLDEAGFVDPEMFKEIKPIGVDLARGKDKSVKIKALPKGDV